MTITVSSALASTTKIFCTASATVQEVTTFALFAESASVTATRSGSTATCTVTIPYSWNLSTVSTDRVSLSYTIIAGVPTTTIPVATRTSEHSLPQISIPANGATTTETVSATI